MLNRASEEPMTAKKLDGEFDPTCSRPVPRTWLALPYPSICMRLCVHPPVRLIPRGRAPGRRRQRQEVGSATQRFRGLPAHVRTTCSLRCCIGKLPGEDIDSPIDRSLRHNHRRYGVIAALKVDRRSHEADKALSKSGVRHARMFEYAKNYD